MASDIQEYEYRITNQFFTDIDGDEVQKGKGQR